MFLGVRMKNLLVKTLLFMLVAVMTVSSIFAQGQGVGDPDNECQDNGFDFGIAKFECDDDEWDISNDEGFPPEGYTVDADGEDCSEVDWTSDPAADGVIEKAGQDVFIHPGGTEGTVKQSGDHEISHITLCGNEENGCEEDCHEIPEFTAIGASLALAGAGLYVYRKRNSK